MKLNNILNEVLNDKDYLKWKRKNVTLRGVKNVGEENNAGAMLGRGLYSAFLSNKSLAKDYGNVYFVLGAIPKKPKVFNTLNDWEIWFGNTLVYNFTKENGEEYPDRRYFDSKTTIEDEMMKLGYDGVIIKGREMVNFTPKEDEISYFKNENQLKDYFFSIQENMKLAPLIESVNIDNVIYHALFVKDIKQLEKDFPQVHPNFYYHHSTIEFRPKNDENMNIGEESTIKIIGRLTTDKVDVLIVENPKSKNNYPHITLSTAKDVKPMESNSEIEKYSDKIEYFENKFIDVIEEVLNK
jgi:hypothetical protein